MRDDIIAGLRSAVERGENLEKAVQSFINAGYNPEEVKAAAQIINGGATEIMEGRYKKGSEQGRQLAHVQNNQLPQMPSTKKMEINQTNNVQKYKSKGSGRKIVLIIVLSIVLLALIGVGIYLFLNLPE